MFKKGLLIFISFILISISHSYANGISEGSVIVAINDSISPTDNEPKPVISYSSAKKYEVADIKISGNINPMYEDYTLIGFSELQVGEVIEIPGAEITNAVKRYWRLGLFSEVEVLADKIEGNKIWIDIRLKSRPLVSDIVFSGVKKGERNDLEGKIGVVRNLQFSQNQSDKAKEIVKKYFDEKGFNKAEITFTEKPDLAKENNIILHIDVQKKNKTKVNRVNIIGTKDVEPYVLEATMKKTRHKSGLRAWIRNFLRGTNYVPDNYEEDKENIIKKYNELGFRDAAILSDTVYAATAEGKPNKMNIDIEVDEGPRYYLRNVRWVGNTQAATDRLNYVLMMKKGDVYNQKKLMERLQSDDDAVMNVFYQNQGYLFSNVNPVEVNIEADSVDLEMRIVEGQPATIRKVSISGNDRVYEDVVRRELRVKPGNLFSRDDIIMTMREIGQIGHFDLENFEPKINPDQEAGVVDIAFPLHSKANDQVEFSAGWGQTGVIGRLSLKFTNFSIKNLFNPSSYKGIIPQGEGQTLTLSAQTNARYYQSYSMSFYDPWFGGKRPNSLSVGLYYSRQTDINSNYYSNSYWNNPYGNYGYGGYGGGYGGYGYGGNDFSLAADNSKSIQMLGASIGYGKRLTWPDENFYAQAELSYQLYKMHDWQYFMVKNGVCNSLALNLTLSRVTVDNPVYPRRGTEFSVSASFTPPFSLWDGKDYASMKPVDNYYEPGEKFKWIEYHKWKFKSKTYTALASTKKTPVLMTRAELGFLGYYDKNKRSPFETFYVGGDGMTGYSSTYATETIGLRGYENGSLGSQASAYTRFGMELRYPLILEPTSTIYLLGFVEAGNAWGNVSDFNPFELKRSAGVGARIMLPMIGLMGIDWAYGFDPVNGSRQYSGSQFHFIIGQEF